MYTARSTMSDTAITTPAPRLPAELTDIVVDFLHDDEENLANCSLVCKGWLPAARYHLFRELLLHPWNFEAFVGLIRHPSATIKPHLHYLAFDQVTFRFWQRELFDTMFLRLPRVDSVRKLEFRHIRWCNYPFPAFDGLIMIFQRITDLRLDTLIFDNPTDLWSVVARLPSLQRLSATNLSYIINQFDEEADVDDIFPHLIPPKIRDLILDEIQVQQTHFLDWLSSRGALVESLSVALGSIVLPSLSKYLQVLGPSLLCLQIDIRYNLSDMYFSQVNLSSNTHLRSLRFSNFSTGSSDALSSKMLANITSSDFSEIEFAYGSHSWIVDENDTTFAMAGHNWKALDDVLSRFSSLRTVRFRGHPSPSDPLLFIDFLKRSLSSCNARGLLSFEAANDGQQISPLYLRPTSRDGVVSGPFCIAQLQEPNV